MLRFVTFRSACLLIFLYASPTFGQRFHRHARRMLSFSNDPAGIATAGTAVSSGYNLTWPLSGSCNSTFKPHRTRLASSDPHNTFSFNPGGPDITPPATLSFYSGEVEIPAPTISATRSAVYTLCNPPEESQSSCSTAYDLQAISSCFTVLTGFFTTVSISDCSQSITFSTQSSFLLTSTTIPPAGLFRRSPTTSTYIQSIVSYSIAPYQSIVADDRRNIAVLVCTYDINGAKDCKQAQQFWQVHVNYVLVTSTSTFAAIVTVSEPFSSGAVMYYGDSKSTTLTAGHNEISAEHVITSSTAVTSTSTSQIVAPTPYSSNPSAWETLDASILSRDKVAKSVALSAVAPLNVHEKAADIVYGPPPGGWDAISYPADAGANLASYPAPAGGWAAVSYPSDAGAHLSTYPAPPGGWGAVSYPPNIGANPPPTTTSVQVSESSALSALTEPRTSAFSSPTNASPTLSSISFSTITLTSTSTVHITISKTSTVTASIPTSMVSLFPTISANGSTASNEIDAIDLTTTITSTRTTTIIVYTVPLTQTI